MASTNVVSFLSCRRKIQHTKSDHIDTDRLSAIVAKHEVLEEHELEHLRDCEKCLEMIRTLVLGTLLKTTNH